jgi:hypothetical protein
MGTEKNPLEPPKITKEQKDYLQSLFPNDTTDPYELKRRANVLGVLRAKLSNGEEVKDKDFKDEDKKHQQATRGPKAKPKDE